jgi:aspartate/methionine/tyrosine aminotransferase
VAAAQRAAADPRAHHYSAPAGLAELRAAVAVKTRRDSGWECDPSQITITVGAKGAVYSVCTVLLDPGDEVLLPVPYWVSYPAIVSLAGATVRLVPSRLEDGYRVTVQDLERARTARTKMLIFCNPGNPTGAVYPAAEVAAIGQWAAHHGIWVLSDEIYEHFTYGTATFASLAMAAPEAVERTIVVNSVAKTYAMTGWRVGWMIGPPAVAAAVARLQSHSVSNVANVSQLAALAALQGPMDPVHEMRSVFDRRRRVMYEMLRIIPGVELLEPEGALYAFPRVDPAATLPGSGATTTQQLAEALLERAEIAVVPGEGFGAPGSLRLSFALDDAELVTGLERWQRLAGQSPASIARARR